MAQYTPMIQQYLAIKREYPDTFLFFRLGDFYELFFDDAITASRELEITLTGRDGGGDERIPMCGVPHHSADAYIAELLKKGYKVAVCEQVEDPKAAKGVVRREVTRVITPGTMMEGKWLTDKENNYMAAIAEADGRMGIAACDMSTGEMYVTSLFGTAGAALDEAMQYRPKELVVCGLSQDLKPDMPVTYIETGAVNAFAVDQQYQDQARELDLAMRLAVNALLHYIGSTQKRSLSHMRLIKRYDAKQYLQMDNFSRRNLELTETIRDKSKKGSLLWLLDRTETAMGGRLLRRWIERPLLNKSELEARLDAVEHLKGDMLLRSDVRACLDRVYDLERLAGRVSYGNANARDLVQLRLSLEAVPELRQLLLNAGSRVLTELAEGMDECADIAAFLRSALVDDPPVSVREGGLIRPGYDEYLDKLHTASREGKNWIAQLEQAEREATGIRSLKVGFNKVFGYYIEVSRANLANVPAGRYERKQTLANAERFITPELKEKEALILEAEEKMVELEYQLFTAIRSEVATHIPRLQGLAERIAAVDVLQAFATVSEERGYVRPELVTTGECVIREGRHPVVEAVLDREKYVANDVEMNQSDRQILLITGPNMAGKSTYMRQIALIVIMAQIGCFVPAKAAKLSLVDQIFTRIGAADDLVGGHSTFMVEMLETKHALQKATAQSLILLDEIGRGTSTYDGMALAQAVIEYIREKIGAKTLFSTHYHELTGLEESLPGVVNVHARCEERDGKLLFLHKIEPGRADKSYGIHVAELAEMPGRVIERAREILAGLEANAAATSAQEVQMTLDALWAAPVSAAKEEPVSRLSPDEETVMAELRELDLNQMTPMEAMLKLYEWRQRLKKT
ncbi:MULTISPECIES: DNA mismatch repair protein MutS [Brevibacillus]|jgi:DNA mismatch repair protein MutS|uniref:DNA mismatch repair protein MutS n=1 Tax=Brevibacillus aydinogluensis TaxID=927786 RepID=A0AA48M9S2_9BACL|nr:MULTISPECIES: DNA mismatch repair protein MutS [Brevibacillus]NNV01904.1 DNA mismatch repair protein MutS [Brevibacillus sp. MCWH]REK64118.1 MAG: DNA mismatch repair protein MutS [Brevibacillus sp.]CAJ1002538.1 DNA mismatch repair protein MutS [Brevibacillus aydinogluensis]